MPAASAVDSWRFLPPRLARLLQARLEASPPVTDIAFAPFTRPLAQARIALLSTAGISVPPAPPFDMDTERANPMWGDPSWRAVPAATRTGGVEINHLHIDTSYALRDLNVALPLERLAELVAAGEVGGMAPTHYSVMGYQLEQSEQLATSAPAIATRMREEGVDGALLAPV